MSFEELKRRSENKDALIQKLTSMDDGEKKSYKDDRFWRPTVDDAGTASAVIRFAQKHRVKRMLGFCILITHSKVRVAGSLKTLAPLSVRKIRFRK